MVEVTDSGRCSAGLRGMGGGGGGVLGMMVVVVVVNRDYGPVGQPYYNMT